MSASNASARGLRLGAFLLMLPLLLWLLLLILLPHVDMVVVSLREHIGFAEHRFSWMHYELFFTESLYWRTFLRTALISIFTTLLTLMPAPIAINPTSEYPNILRFFILCPVRRQNPTVLSTARFRKNRGA